MQTLHDENIRLKTRLEMTEELTGKRVEDVQKLNESLQRELEKTRDEVKQLTSELGYLKGKTETREG